MSRTVRGCPEVDAALGSLDPMRAVEFLEHRGCDLRYALARPDEAEALERLRKAQAASHEAWLALIGAAADANGARAADEITSLYALHGRVAAWLERGLDPRLGPEVALRVRMHLLGLLQEQTAVAIAALLDSAPLTPEQV